MVEPTVEIKVVLLKDISTILMDYNYTDNYIKKVISIAEHFDLESILLLVQSGSTCVCYHTNVDMYDKAFILQEPLTKDMINALLERYDGVDYHIVSRKLFPKDIFTILNIIKRERVNLSTDKIKISKVTEYEIKFSNGDEIHFGHEQDCCEYNYADFQAIDDLAYDYEFTSPLLFERVEGCGFRFGNEGKMVFVPCYSEQNGYYSSLIDIYYNSKVVLGLMGCELRLI